MKKILLYLFIFIFKFNYALALIQVDITRGNLDPLPIAVSPLHVDPSSENIEGIKVKNLGENISKVI
jgi:TolB protein